jgi:hypothetical protein
VETIPLAATIQREAGSVGNEELSSHQLNLKVYLGGNAAGSYSVYVGLQNPASKDLVECRIYPFYLSGQGLRFDRRIVMTRNRPFAWLQRIEINREGAMKMAPFDDDRFRRELASFSETQSKKLCSSLALCGAVDAHYAQFLPPQPVKLDVPAAPAGLATAPPAAPGAASMWMIGGSVVRLEADGERRRFVYETVAEGSAGIKRGALLFDGKRQGTRYVGTAYAFARDCTAESFSVSGDVSRDERQVTLKGRIPVIDSRCRVRSRREGALDLRFIEPKGP